MLQPNAREVREQVEDDFKNRPKPDSINTLVATSTLEMGIDIGSLNTVVNTDTPPLVSNFLCLALQFLDQFCSIKLYIFFNGF